MTKEKGRPNLGVGDYGGRQRAAKTTDITGPCINKTLLHAHTYLIQMVTCAARIKPSLYTCRRQFLASPMLDQVLTKVAHRTVFQDST